MVLRPSILDFIVASLELDGEKLVDQYKEPLGAIKDIVGSQSWRRGRDSNPRYRVTAHLFSRQANSTTLAPLRIIITRSLYHFTKGIAEFA